MDRRTVARPMANISTRQSRTHLGMISRSHFTRIADTHEVDAKTVERDYVLTHAVTAIAQQAAEHGLVFKGGTALRLCYFEDYRYSADLVRHEAPYDRAGVKGLRRGPVAA